MTKYKPLLVSVAVGGLSMAGAFVSPAIRQAGAQQAQMSYA